MTSGVLGHTKQKMSVIVWGTGVGGEKAKKALEWSGYKITAFCDGNSEKKEFDGYEVISPEQLESIVQDEKAELIVIGVFNKVYEKEIRERINAFGKKVQVKTLGEISNDYEKAYLNEQKKNLVYKWDVEFESQSQEWVDNLDSEVQYWIRENAKETGAYHQEWINRLNNNKFMNSDCDSKYIAEQLEEGDIVIDIGCGLTSMYGDELADGRKINLIAVDPLAHFYNIICKKYAGGKEKGKEIQFGLFEFIANFFPESYADYIIVNNALDHCIDPYKSIIECIHVLKVGGVLHLRHRQAEAVFEDWTGLHKWNVDCNENEELILWNKKNAVNVSESLKDIADVQIKHVDAEERSDCKIIATITKMKEFDLQSFYSSEEESRACFALMDKLMKKMVTDSRERFLGK